MKKAWLSLLALTIAGSIGTACTITTTDDDTVGGSTGFGGAAGSGGSNTSGGATAKGGASSGGTAGSAAGGASSGGKASGGTGGEPEPVVMCDVDENPTGTPADSCVFVAPDNTPCHECLAKVPECCTAIRECYGKSPYNQCAYGGPDGGSEYTCIENCIRQKVLSAGSYTNDDEDVCVNACATPACGLIGNATSVILGCMHAHCETECFEPR
jgi:hypothetical protein